MNLLNLIEDTTTGYDNLRALMQASQSGQDAVLNIGGETVTLDPMETRWIFSKYKAFNKAGRQEEFLNHLADPVKFDQHMKQLRQLIDKQKNFRGSVPGQRGVDENLVAGIVAHEIEKFLDEPNPSTGVAEETVEEIAMSNPERPTQETAGKINWERMIKDYMDNKPYTEFEFGTDRPLTLYRSQVYAILKDFGRMKPPQKVKTILSIFGDKTAMVDYLDKLRAKGMMPKKVPAYVAPGVEPVPPGQMAFPGMEAPKIREANAQKKNSEITELDRKAIVNPRVARAFQLARARQTAAGSDIEAFVQDELEKQTQTDQTIKDLEAVNRRQDAALKKAQALDVQQGNDISDIEAQLGQVAQKLQIVKTAKPRADQRSSTQAATTPTQPVVQQPTAAEPQAPAEPTDIQQQPTDVEQPTTAKKKSAPRKKSGATKVSKPRKANKPIEVPAPDNVLAFPQGGRRRNPEPAVAQDELSAALSGVDIPGTPATGTYGLREGNQELNVGDPVIIGGNVEHAGKTGDVSGFGRDKHFVIVDLYNFGKHAFHASNVQYNDYADEEDYVEEMQTKLDRSSVNQPPPGGSNKQREAFLDARDRLFRQMNGASPGEREAIRLKIADLEGRAQAQGIRIRESDDLNRAGYNAIKSVSDWEEKMRVMRELQKDQVLMSDPEAKAAVQQRIGDLLKVGVKQGYVNEALNDKAMAVLRSLQQPAQPAPAAVDLNVPAGPRRGRPTNAQRAQRHEEFLTLRRRIALLDELIKMKEQIDNLFLKAQNVRGGIYPGLQADIEMEELYPVPETDRQFQDLRDKYTKDLAALQKFLAMKKAVYREDEDLMLGESTALVRLKQARQALSQQGVAEDAEPMDREFALVKKLGRLGERIVQNPKLWNKYSEVVESNDPDWIISLIQDGTGATYKEVLRLSDLFGEIGGGLGRIIDFAWAVKEGTWEEDFLTPYRKYRSEWDLAEGSEQVYNIVAVDKGNAMSKPKKLTYKAGSIEEVFDALAANDWYPLEINGVEVINGKHLNQGVAEGLNESVSFREMTDVVDQHYPKYYAELSGSDISDKQFERAIVNAYKAIIKKQGVAEGYLNEFTPAGRDPWGNDDRGEDPYGRPQPRHYNRSIDFFGQFEADHFDREDFDDSTGIFKGYWDNDQIAYFKFDNPQRNGSDDPGMGWYYEPQNESVAEAQTDYQRRRQRERDVDAGRPVKPLPKNPQTDYAKKRAKDRRDMELGEEQVCSECGGPSFSDLILAEKQDACYHKVKSRYKVWPSAYASGALVQCRKKGAANWGNKKK